MTKDNAAIEIAKILGQLERDQKALVERVTIVDVDVANYDSRFQKEIARRVVIDLRAVPGSQWPQSG